MATEKMASRMNMTAVIEIQAVQIKRHRQSSEELEILEEGKGIEGPEFRWSRHDIGLMFANGSHKGDGRRDKRIKRGSSAMCDAKLRMLQAHQNSFLVLTIK